MAYAPLVSSKPLEGEARPARTGQPTPGRGHLAMRRRDWICFLNLSLILTLSVGVGCSGLGMRLGRRRDLPTPDQGSQAQQYSERAQAAIDRGDLESARTEMLQLVAHSPTSAEAHHRLGRILQLQGRLSEAEACFRKALELDHDYVGALIGLGTIEAAKGEPQSALKRFETAIEIEPNDAEAHFARAGILEVLGRTDDALAAYFRTLEFNPLHPEVSLRIGAIQLARNQPDQALVRLDQAVDQAPDDGEAHLLRGRAHLVLHHAPQAIVDFRIAARQLSGRADVHYQLALALEAAHLKGEALRAAETALQLSPGYAEARTLSERLRR